MTTRALKLKIEPTKNNYKILNEAFWKWSSLANRVSQKGRSKETLSPLEDSKEIQFNATQLNQIEKDVKDLRGAMEEQKKQKERLLVQVQDRLLDIKEMLEHEDKKERDINGPQNFKPVGWRKFHTFKHWNGELVKLTRQEQRIKKTIEKINAGKINFKPKRIGLWSGKYKINFLNKKLSLDLFNSGNIELNLVTEPYQSLIGKKDGKSSLNSKKYLDEGIKSLLAFAIHSRFFGLNNSDKYLLGGRITPNLVKYYKKNGDIDDFKREIIERLEKKLKQGLSEEQKGEIFSQIDRQYKDRESAFSNNYLSTIEEASKIFNERKMKRVKYLLQSFDEKVEQLKKEIGTNISSEDWNLIISEAEKAYNNEYGFTSHIYSSKYLEVLDKIVNNILSQDIYFDLRKYPILIRKSIKNSKKIGNLRPNQWEYYIQFGYDSINPIQLAETKNILGIDRGLTHLLAYSIFEPKNKMFIINQLEPNPISGWKWRLRKLKRSIQHLERRVRAENGVKLFENQMKKKLKSIESKIENYYHNISRKIVNIAKLHNASIILESLEGGGLKQHGRKKNSRARALNYALSLFDYGKIASLIKYKAELEGIPMYEVLPAYTSQNCARCVLEKKSFVEPETRGYVDEIESNPILLSSIFEDTEIFSPKVMKKYKKYLEIFGIDKDGNKVEILLKISFNKISIIQKKDNENIAEFPIKESNGRYAILDYVYKRGKEIKEKKIIYTGNKKAGYCSKHGQIDADLNASRVIALCKYFNINEPIVFGENRKTFK